MINYTPREYIEAVQAEEIRGRCGVGTIRGPNKYLDELNRVRLLLSYHQNLKTSLIHTSTVIPLILLF